METWTEELKIRLHETDSNQKISPTNLLGHLQEVAVNHSKEHGFGKTTLEKENKMWVLNKTQVEMIEYPSFGDSILIETWVKNVYKSLSQRESTLKSKNTGKTIGHAISLWVCIDINSYELKDIGENIMKKMKPSLKTSYFKNVKRIKPLTEYQSSKLFKANYTDIDALNHVNNSKYLEWTINAVDSDFHQNYLLKAFTLNYENSIFLNDNIRLELSEETKKDSTSIHFKIHSNENTQIACLIELEYFKG